MGACTSLVARSWDIFQEKLEIWEISVQFLSVYMLVFNSDFKNIARCCSWTIMWQPLPSILCKSEAENPAQYKVFDKGRISLYPVSYIPFLSQNCFLVSWNSLTYSLKNCLSYLNGSSWEKEILWSEYVYCFFPHEKGMHKEASNRGRRTSAFPKIDSAG